MCGAEICLVNPFFGVSGPHDAEVSDVLKDNPPDCYYMVSNKFVNDLGLSSLDPM